jgi:hypothetical protein
MQGNIDFKQTQANLGERVCGSGLEGSGGEYLYF